MPRRPIRHGGIRPLCDFEEEARERMDFVLGANADVDPAEVPSDLRHLVPLVCRWALRGSAPQNVFIEHLERTAPQSIAEFRMAVSPHVDRIRRLIQDALGSGGPCPEWLSHFSFMLSAFQLTTPLDSNLIAACQAKNAQARHREQRTQDITESIAAMRKRDYRAVVDLLAPHEPHLGDVERKRLELARKKM